MYKMNAFRPYKMDFMIFFLISIVIVIVLYQKMAQHRANLKQANITKKKKKEVGSVKKNWQLLHI